MTKTVQFSDVGKTLTYSMWVCPAGSVITQEWTGDVDLHKKIAAHLIAPITEKWMERFALVTQAAALARVEWTGPFSSEPEQEFDRVV